MGLNYGNTASSIGISVLLAENRLSNIVTSSTSAQTYYLKKNNVVSKNILDPKYLKNS